MKAVVYSRYGLPDNLRSEDVDQPIPKDSEVIVKVHAASINSWDWDALRGNHLIVRLISGWLKPRNRILGADVAGTVEAVGKKAKDFSIGDEVFGDIAGNGFGGLAQYVSVPEKLLARKSPAMTFEQAAALPQAGLLALQGLRYKGTIKTGGQVLINGAGGGVGTLAVQYAKSEGAEVACVDIPEKFPLLRFLGADACIDCTQVDYTRNGFQYDRILDVIAHRSIGDYRRALKPGGTFAMIGGSMGWLLVKLMVLSPLLSSIGNKNVGLMGYRPNRVDLDLLTRLFEQGKVKPVIDKVYPLEETPEAFRYFGTGQVKGKIVIRVAGN